jgi:hypothetical protein
MYVSRDIKKELICQLVRVRELEQKALYTTHFFGFPAWCHTWGTCWFENVVGVVLLFWVYKNPKTLKLEMLDLKNSTQP